MIISLLCIGFCLFALVTMSDNNKLKQSLVNGMVPVPAGWAQLGGYSIVAIAFGQMSTLIPAIIATVWYCMADETRFLMLAAAAMLWIATYSWVTMIRTARLRWILNGHSPT